MIWLVFGGLLSCQIEDQELVVIAESAQTQPIQEVEKSYLRALKKNGFYIQYTHPNLLFISWKKIPESHYPHSKRTAAPKKTKPPVEKEKNIGEYRDITDKEHELPYNTKILNNLEGRLRDILR